MNRVTIRINGIEYNLKGEEREEYLHKIASYVDKKLKSIEGNNPKLSTTSAAILTAVNAVDDLFKCDLAYSELLEKLEVLQKNEGKLLKQIDELKEQIAQYEKAELEKSMSKDEQIEPSRITNEEAVALSEELESVKENNEKLWGEFNDMKSENKELKFQLQSARYKIIDLQNKLVENQISLVKVQKMSNPLVNNSK